MDRGIAASRMSAVGTGYFCMGLMGGGEGVGCWGGWSGIGCA
jgi:hypothetical protein